jgi:hypothetical protein
VEEVVIAAVLTGLPVAAWGANTVRHNRREKRRRIGLEELASKRGWSYTRERNAIAGEVDGVATRIFDQRAGARGGHHRWVLAQTVVELTSTRLALPAFRIEPENVIHKMQEAMGAQDIDFASHPHFSDRYLLRGESEEEIRKIFTPQVLDWFEGHLGLTVEGSGERLSLHRGSTLEAHQIEEEVALVRELFGLLAR